MPSSTASADVVLERRREAQRPLDHPLAQRRQRRSRGGRHDSTIGMLRALVEAAQRGRSCRRSPGATRRSPLTATSVPGAVAEAEADVVTADEHRERVVLGEVDREGEAPPSAVVDRFVVSLATRSSASREVPVEAVDLPDVVASLGRSRRRPRTAGSGTPRAASRRTMHSCGSRGERQQGDDPPDDLRLERHVVVHEQHVRRPPLVAQLHQAAGEPTGAAEVAVGDDRRCSDGARLELEVAGVVDDLQPHVRSPRSGRCSR